MEELDVSKFRHPKPTTTEAVFLLNSKFKLRLDTVLAEQRGFPALAFFTSQEGWPYLLIANDKPPLVPNGFEYFLIKTSGEKMDRVISTGEGLEDIFRPIKPMTRIPKVTVRWDMHGQKFFAYRDVTFSEVSLPR